MSLFSLQIIICNILYIRSSLNFHLAKQSISYSTTFTEIKKGVLIMSFPIYHYYFRGLYIYKTDTVIDIFDSVSRDLGSIPSDMIDSLIMNHEYHLCSFEGERMIDIIVVTSDYGKQVV